MPTGKGKSRKKASKGDPVWPGYWVFSSLVPYFLIVRLECWSHMTSGHDFSTEQEWATSPASGSSQQFPCLPSPCHERLIYTNMISLVAYKSFSILNSRRLGEDPIGTVVPMSFHICNSPKAEIFSSSCSICCYLGLCDVTYIAAINKISRWAEAAGDVSYYFLLPVSPFFRL